MRGEGADGGVDRGQWDELGREQINNFAAWVKLRTTKARSYLFLRGNTDIWTFRNMIINHEEPSGAGRTPRQKVVRAASYAGIARRSSDRCNNAAWQSPTL